MTGEEFVEWMAYERLEPFGPLADEFRLGQVCATMANIKRTKDTAPFEASQFMPGLRRALDLLKPEPKSMTDEEHATLMDAELFGIVKPKAASDD